MARKPQTGSAQIFKRIADFFSQLANVADAESVEWPDISLETFDERYNQHFSKASLSDKFLLKQQRTLLLEEIRTEIASINKLLDGESISNSKAVDKLETAAYIKAMQIMRKIRELSENIGIDEAELMQFIVAKTSIPEVKQRIAEAPAGPSEFSRDPLHAERTVKRLLEKFHAAAKEFVALPEESRERLLAGYTLINAYEALKKRGHPVDDLPERDKVTEARRLKQAARRTHKTAPS